jgi:hypothetical protein
MVIEAEVIAPMGSGCGVEAGGVDVGGVEAGGGGVGSVAVVEGVAAR